MDIARREDIVTPYLLERNAAEAADGLMATFEDSSTWTYAQALSVARRAANALYDQGVRQGDHVGVLLPNGKEFLTAWLGIAALGAVFVPMNLSFKGTMLGSLVAKTMPKVVVTIEPFASTLGAVSDVPLIAPTQLAGGADRAVPRERDIEVWDTHHIMLTSGTTGPSKAARCSHLHFHNLGLYGTVFRGLDESDVFLIDLPLYHTAALGMVGGCLSTRTPISVRSGPDLNRYWETMKETGATTAVLISSMVGFLLGRAPSPTDTDHRIRFLIAIPLPNDLEQFQKRFNIPELVTAYGGTEPCTVMTNRVGEPLIPNSCGSLIPGYHARIVDEHDFPVALGAVGEMVLRHDHPWAISTEYVGDPEATAQAWRNGWYHTGDLFRQDESGHYYFVDRSKDAVRRRGVNISCFEIEQAVLKCPGVQEVAGVAHPSEVGADDEIKVWIVPEQGTTVDFVGLVKRLHQNVPHFMVPRYYELIDALPKNPTTKVQKFVLRDKGNSESTWDVERDGGLRVTSRGLIEI
ncbi:AMP-binding protein [Nocardia vaccinii]|uniref:AMP-binding protein n=1 Tax=Nocardia vaccinii TaxID=1822 RepID=UPI000831D674|nr:AMP-binding protein [Nocardia vaccinii]